MNRIYNKLLDRHFRENRQMVFLMGPRQVGKTTTSLMTGDTAAAVYFNWDDHEDRELILKGPQAVSQKARLDQLHETPPRIVFDEIHKFPKWQTFMKGFFDKYHTRCRIIVTGSSRLDVYRKGGDSLMGRVIYYRMHPLSVGEILDLPIPETEINIKPRLTKPETIDSLTTYSGFPEPFLKASNRFYNQWSTLRQQQLVRDDIRDLSHIQEIHQMELLAELLKQQVGQLTSYSALASKVRVSVDTIRRWIEIFKSFYYCFSVHPWSKNVSRSLIKEPKYYLWNWSLAPDTGACFENLVASHLLKAVHFWTDSGFGEYDLYFLRDKEKREVDFLVSRNKKPWFLVEAKKSSTSISSYLEYFQKQTMAQHAFQVVGDMDFVNKNCFAHHDPIVVPARTFLGQLV